MSAPTTVGLVASDARRSAVRSVVCRPRGGEEVGVSHDRATSFGTNKLPADNRPLTRRRIAGDRDSDNREGGRSGALMGAERGRTMLGNIRASSGLSHPMDSPRPHRCPYHLVKCKKASPPEQLTEPLEITHSACPAAHAGLPGQFLARSGCNEGARRLVRSIGRRAGRGGRPGTNRPLPLRTPRSDFRHGTRKMTSRSAPPAAPTEPRPPSVAALTRAMIDGDQRPRRPCLTERPLGPTMTAAGQ